MDPPPPPPPPHGQNPKSSGLPPGNYDIFIIPPHSSGSGFIYLPSLQPNVNSFAAGFASALLLVALGSAAAPAAQVWWVSIRGSGGAGMFMVVIGIAMGAWALGRMQNDRGKGPGPGPGPGGGSPPGGSPGGTPPHSNGYASGAPPPPKPGPYPGAQQGSQGPPPRAGGYGGQQHGQQHGQQQQGPQSGERPRSSWQRTNPPPGATGASATGDGAGTGSSWQRPNPPPPPPPGATGNNTSGAGAGAGSSYVPKGGWEKAREETRKREEERKAREAERKKKEEDEKRLKEAREREAREREVREREAREREARLKEAREREARERDAREREAREREAGARLERIEKEKLEKERERERERVRELEKREKEERETREKERKEKEEREKKAREQKAREEKEKAEQAAKVELEAPKYKGSTYAFSSVGEKTNPWPRGQPAAAAAPRSVPPPSPKKPPPPPTARTYLGTDEDAYSFRPYDKPRTPHKKSASSIYSESSYAASQSTSRTTPPPSHRGPYTTNDPDKIVIKAVYCFTNAFTKTPASQLVSGTGSVTDGLILRITTEGLFIDDDVRGVPQREWDVKAWTMKLVEVYCPLFRQGSLGSSSSTPQHAQKPVRRLWGDAKNRDKVALNEDADALLVRLLGTCKASCRLGTFASAAFDADADADDAFGSEVNAGAQNGEHKASKLHVLRASIRDQEGKRYVFVLGEEEGWKVAVGLQRLRKGTQVRALGVSGMSTSDSRGMLENLGWV